MSCSISPDKRIITVSCNTSPLFRTCDLSKKADAKGEDVVDEAIRKLKLATPDWEDHSLMKRLAYVESDFGEDDFVMKNNTNGGIWQVNLFITTSWLCL